MKKKTGRLVFKDDKKKLEIRVHKRGFVIEVDGIWVVEGSNFGTGYGLPHIALRTEHLDTFDRRHSGRMVPADNFIKSDKFYVTYKHVNHKDEVPEPLEVEQLQ